MNSFQPLFDRQKERFHSEATKTAAWRLDQLDRLEHLLTENSAAFSEALAADFKTSSLEQTIEFGGALAAIAEAREHLTGWMTPTPAPLPAAFARSGHRAAVYRDPYGVSLIIAPFNAPLILLIDPLIAALAAGNTAIVKPAEATSRMAELYERLFASYFDPADVAVVRGNREQVSELLTLPFDFIFFTGSTAVGKVVMRAAAENLTPVVLELGGQNPAIVDETANVADAARKLVWGAMAFGGQWCVSPGYVYVHESVVDKFNAAAREAITAFYGPDPKTTPDFSRIISERDVQRLGALIDPAKVIAGGEVDAAARYVAPTLLYPVSWEDPVMQEEIFGPILPVIPYTDLDAIIGTIKRRPKALSGYLFSTNENRIDRLLSELSFGGGAVNQTVLQVMFSSLPFGGVGASGMGQYFGRTGFETMSHAKSVVFSPAEQSVDVFFPPYDDTTTERFAALMS